MIEQTLVLIKPDGIQRALVGEIISRFEKCGLKIVAVKMDYADKERAGKHYIDDEAWLNEVGKKSIESYAKKGITMKESAKQIGLKVRQYLIDFLSMSPIIALVIEGHNAVSHVRKIVGSTSPGDAIPGTIRGDYSFDTYTLSDKSNRTIQNLVHASGTPEEAKREIQIWFKQEEIHAWKRIDEELLYRRG